MEKSGNSVLVTDVSINMKDWKLCVIPHMIKGNEENAKEMQKSPSS